MNKFVFVSLEPNAGKTSIIMALAKITNKKCGYIKPFGDRLLYKKKRLWDYDADLAVNFLDMEDDAENITLGFEHSKLRFMYNEESMKKELCSLVDKTSKGKEVLFVEAGERFSFGSSVYLDVINIAKNIGGKIIIIASGKPDYDIDEINFILNTVDKNLIEGVIFNKVDDIDDFKAIHEEYIKNFGIKLISIIPYEKKLSQISLRQVGDYLLAKVIAGDKFLTNKIEYVYVGATSANKKIKKDFFQEKRTLFITSGDRSDVILEALEYDAAGIILTNNIFPPSNIISVAEQKNIPVLSVSSETFKVAKKINDINPLLEKDDHEKLKILTELLKDKIDLNI